MAVNIALLIGTSLAWAAGYLFIGAARDVPPITATAVMTIIAAVVIAAGVRWGLRRPLVKTLTRRPWVPMVMGLSAIALPNLSVVVAEHSVAPDLAAVIGTTVPIATLLLTIFVTHESRYSHLRILGIPIALAGLVIFLGGKGGLDHRGELDHILIMMAGGLVFALNGIFTARQTRDLDAPALAAWTIAFGAVWLTLAAFAFEQPLSVDLASAAWALAGEGIVGMGLAFLGYYVLVARAGAGFASLYAFLVPPLGVIGSALVTGASLTTAHAAGVAVVLIGLFFITRGAGAPPAAR